MMWGGESEGDGLAVGDYSTIDGDTSVGAYGSASRATNTRQGIFGESEVIPAVVHLLGLKEENVLRASHDAKVATLTSLPIYFYRAYYFGHYLMGLCGTCHGCLMQN